MKLKTHLHDQSFYDPYNFGYFFYSNKPPYDLRKIIEKPTPPKSLPKAPISLDLSTHTSRASISTKAFSEETSIDSSEDFKKQKTELFKRYMAKEISKDEYFHLYKELRSISGNN